DAGNQMDLVAARFFQRGAFLGERGFWDGIDLVERHDLRLVGQAMTIGFEFATDRLVAFRDLGLGAVDQMQDHVAAFGMAQKLVAQAYAFMRPLYQSGKIRDHEIGFVDANHAELWCKRGERIIGDLRFGARYARQERRFAGIGKADQSGIGDELETKDDGLFFAGLAGIGVTRSLIGGAFEMRVAEAAIAALEQQQPITFIGEIGDESFAVFFQNLRADGHAHDRVIAARTRHLLAHAGQAVLGADVLLVAIVDQRVEVFDRFGPDIAALAAIAAVRSAIFDELLAPERDAAVTAVAGLDIDLGLVEESHAADFRSVLRMIGRCAARRATTSKPARANVDATPVWTVDAPFFSAVSHG